MPDTYELAVNVGEVHLRGGQTYKQMYCSLDCDQYPTILYTHPTKRIGIWNQCLTIYFTHERSREQTVHCVVKLWGKPEQQDQQVQEFEFIAQTKFQFVMQEGQPKGCMEFGRTCWFPLTDAKENPIGKNAICSMSISVVGAFYPPIEPQPGTLHKDLWEATGWIAVEIPLFLLKLAKKFKHDHATAKACYIVALAMGTTRLPTEVITQVTEILAIIGNAPMTEVQQTYSEDAALENVITKLKDLEATISNLSSEQIGPKNAQYLLKKATQFEAEENFVMARKYYHVVHNEANPTSEVYKQAIEALAKLAKRKEEADKKQLEENLRIAQKEIEDRLQFARDSAATKEELAKQKERLDWEREAINRRKVELQEQEQKLQQFAGKCAEWERKLEAQDNKGGKEANQLLSDVRSANDEVQKDKSNYHDKLAKADHARAKLWKSETNLQEKEDRLNDYLTIVAQQNNVPGAAHFRELLKATKHLTSSLFPNKIKCFVSYAWNTERRANAILQANLVKIKSDLEKAGIEVLLDIHNMQGDINKYMIDGIQQSDKVLLICTPRFKERAEDKSADKNNLQKELDAALARQTQDPKFIIPLVLEGNRNSSIASGLPNILSLDFTDANLYAENMISLAPKGLIPMILGLERHKVYAQLLKGYQAHLQLLSMRR